MKLIKGLIQMDKKCEEEEEGSRTTEKVRVCV